MPSVIERVFLGSDPLGEDRPSTFEAADALAGFRLDRRRNYAIIEGEVHACAQWTQACSGCYEGYDAFSSRGHGCNECGFTGRCRHSHWAPLPQASAPQAQGEK